MSVSSARYDILIADVKRIYADMKAAVKNGTATRAQLHEACKTIKEKHQYAKEKKEFFYFSFFKDKKIERIARKIDALIGNLP